jgi:hypothetical protein
VVHRQIVDRLDGEVVVTERTHSVDAANIVPDPVTFFAATPTLCEVGPGELVTITCDETVVTPSQLATHLVFSEPDPNLTGLVTLDDSTFDGLLSDVSTGSMIGTRSRSPRGACSLSK